MKDVSSTPMFRSRVIGWAHALIVVGVLLIAGCRVQANPALLDHSTERPLVDSSEVFVASPVPQIEPTAVPRSPSATTATPAPTADDGSNPFERTSPLDEPVPTTAPTPPGAERESGGDIDLARARSDVACDIDLLNDFGGIDTTVAHYVVDGDLGAPCFGETDRQLVRSWEILAAITPPGQLHDLGLFTGFDSDEELGVTYAYVTPLDFEGLLFSISVNLDEAQADPDELMLTMAHEFAHVLTTSHTQIDTSVGADDCDTFFDGDVCYRPDSLLYE